MSEQDRHDRFEELEAGRVLGDLTAEETQEWQELSETHGFGSAFSLELTAAAIETEYMLPSSEAMPASLAVSLRKGIPRFVVQEPNPLSTLLQPVWKRLYNSSKAAWGLAALLALFLAINFISQDKYSLQDKPIANAPVSPREARDLLFRKTDDLMESDFGGTENYIGMSGKVVWSDSLQEGYMTLTNLPANDPSKNQYQLWIVDPARDEKPVNGGVFNIQTGENTAIVPVRNPLLVTKPQAFVITLEQPGGVVVSKQEVVVALAKVS
jgi:anti-sigma-K factor RskA